MNTSKTSMEIYHYPVMLKEVIKICKPENGGTYLDCTFGGGGYTKEILKFPNTKVFAIDRDDASEKKADFFKLKFKDRFTFFKNKFSNLDKIIKKDEIDVIIFDLGISSIQLKDLSRGFSFKSQDKLNMSMGLS